MTEIGYKQLIKKVKELEVAMPFSGRGDLMETWLHGWLMCQEQVLRMLEELLKNEQRG